MNSTCTVGLVSDGSSSILRSNLSSWDFEKLYIVSGVGELKTFKIMPSIWFPTAYLIISSISEKILKGGSSI